MNDTRRIKIKRKYENKLKTITITKCQTRQNGTVQYYTTVQYFWYKIRLLALCYYMANCSKTSTKFVNGETKNNIKKIKKKNSKENEKQGDDDTVFKVRVWDGKTRHVWFGGECKDRIKEDIWQSLLTSKWSVEGWKFCVCVLFNCISAAST